MVQTNKTTTLALPLALDFKDKLLNYIENAYIGNDKYVKTNDKDYIFLLANRELPENLHNDIINLSNFITWYEHNSLQVCYVLQIPEKYIEDYKKYTMGLYSKMSIDAKERIIKQFTGNKNDIRNKLSPSEQLLIDKASEFLNKVEYPSLSERRKAITTKEGKELLNAVKQHGELMSILSFDKEWLIDNEFKPNINKL